MAKQDNIGLGFLDILFPFFIPLKGVAWIGEKVKEMAETEMFDESRVKEELLELERDELNEEEYEKREDKLMEKLEEIKKYKEREKG